MKLVIFSTIFSLVFSVALPKDTDTSGQSNTTDGRTFLHFPASDGQVVHSLMKNNKTVMHGRSFQGDVQFWHYLSGDENGKRINIKMCGNCLSKFNADAPTVFIVHGFGGGKEGPLPESLLEAFSKRKIPTNIIVVDWGVLAQAPFYATASDNVKEVGKYVAKMIEFLIESKVTSIDKIIYIGHSLGTHVGNYVAQNLPADKKLHRIYALDPALPLFDGLPLKERIDSSDARFVIVVHTAMGSIVDGGLAFVEPLGHVDFYPNWGKNQPGCPTLDFGYCSHSRSYYYLAESIQSPSAFPACKCQGWKEFNAGKCPCDPKQDLNFGWEISDTTRGIYYFETNDQEPYGKAK